MHYFILTLVRHSLEKGKTREPRKIYFSPDKLARWFQMFMLLLQIIVRFHETS